MQILTPKYWQNKINFFSIILLPISIIIFVISFLKKNFSIPKKFDIPIICVGNIYIGGTGKTPLSIFIANYLKKTKKIVIIKKYYKEHADEHQLIASKSNFLILNKNRKNAIEEAQKKNFEAVILDDGFQDHSIKKDLNIICFNSKQLIGNGFIFPSGPLRESINSLKNAEIIVINGEKNKIFEQKILNIKSDLSIFYANYYPTNIRDFKNKKLLAFAGIGAPENFFDLLEINNLDVIKKVSFPDHYKFTRTQILNIIHDAKDKKLEIVTTEKDYHRIKNYGFKDINYLKIELQMTNEKKFVDQILNFL